MLAATGLAALFIASLGPVGCGSSSDSTVPATSLGTPAHEDMPIVGTVCLSGDKLGQTVAVEGEIVQQCPSTGCWFRLKDDAGAAFVDLNPAKLRLRENRVGEHAKVTGRVAKHGGQFRLEAQHIAFTPANKDAPSDEN
jgi:RecJ-like exonuclease